MRRLLVVSYFFPPLAGGGVHRALALVRHLPRCGWTCTVLCAGVEDYWVRDESLLARVPEDAEVLRVPGGSAAARGLRWMAGGAGRRPSRVVGMLRTAAAWLQVPDAYVGWARRASRTAAARVSRGDVSAVLSTSPPDSIHAVGRAAARAGRLPWVADFRDPWVGLTFKSPPTAWHHRRHAALERGVLGDADLVTVASRTHASELGKASGGGARRAEHWPNGFEPDPEAAAESSPPAAPAGRMLLVYTGTLSLMPDCEVFLEALGELCKRHPEARRRVRAVLAGPHDSSYPDRALGLGLVGVAEFPGLLDHAGARALQRGAALLLLWKPHGVAYRTMVPGKLYEYLAARRPILGVLPPDDEAAALVRAGGGDVVAPGRRDLVLEALERHYRRFAEPGTPALPPLPWLEEHERPRLVRRMAGWLDELVAAREARP